MLLLQKLLLLRLQLVLLLELGPMLERGRIAARAQQELLRSRRRAESASEGDLGMATSREPCTVTAVARAAAATAAALDAPVGAAAPVVVAVAPAIGHWRKQSREGCTPFDATAVHRVVMSRRRRNRCRDRQGRRWCRRRLKP